MRLLEWVICEYGVPDRRDWWIDAPSPYPRGYGDEAARVDAGFTDFTVATSVFDDAAVEVDPRVSLPCAAWKRDTLFLDGPPLPGVGVSAEGKLRSVAGPGVGGGDRNATVFLCPSACAPLEPLLLLLVLRELRPAESASMARGDVDETVTSTTCICSLPSVGGSGVMDAVGVGLAEDSFDDDVCSSPGGGNGRDDISGSGLYTDDGVAPDRCGGHIPRGGSWGIFSFCTLSCPLSFSLESPRLMR